MKRVLRQSGDTTIYFGSEDGVHYRGHRQDHDPIKKHIRYLDDKVNSAPTAGNKNGWRYAGSIPTTKLVEWLTLTRTPIDQWARNTGGAKDRFMQWLKADSPALFPKTAASAKPTITVPMTYRKREASQHGST